MSSVLSPRPDPVAGSDGRGRGKLSGIRTATGTIGVERRRQLPNPQIAYPATLLSHRTPARVPLSFAFHGRCHSSEYWAFKLVSESTVSPTASVLPRLRP